MKQYYKSSASDNGVNIISQKLNVKCDICEIIDKDFENTNRFEKSFDTKFDSQFEDYRNIDAAERTNYISVELSKLQFHRKSREINIVDVMVDFDATS